MNNIIDDIIWIYDKQLKLYTHKTDLVKFYEMNWMKWLFQAKSKIIIMVDI